MRPGLAGLATIPAVVREADDRESLLLALVENVAREDLSPIDEARAYASLIDEFGLSLGDVAERVGRSKPTVSNRIRLLELPEDVLALVERGQLSEGHARAVLGGARSRGAPTARAPDRPPGSVRAGCRARRALGRCSNPTASGVADRPTRRWPSGPAWRWPVSTGADVRVGRGRLELRFADETELAELVEALERAAADSDWPPDAEGRAATIARRRAISSVG